MNSTIDSTTIHLVSCRLGHSCHWLVPAHSCRRDQFEAVGQLYRVGIPERFDYFIAIVTVNGVAWLQITFSTVGVDRMTPTH
jgi:hypothetical protein